MEHNTAVEIASEYTHKLLAYVNAVTRRGSKLSKSDFEAYAQSPTRHTKLARGFFNSAAALHEMFEDRRVPNETWIDYLSRVAWIFVENDRVRLTLLGKAVLDELSTPATESNTENSTEVVLDPSDPLAYVKVIGVLSDVGEGLLVDPYFRYDQLEIIVEHTGIRRVLTSKKTGATAISQLQFALGVLEEAQRPEIRMADSLHDRFAIGDNGPVVAIGTSLNSTGKNHSVVMPVHPLTGGPIRSAYTRLWEEGEPLAPRTQNDRN